MRATALIEVMAWVMFERRTADPSPSDYEILLHRRTYLCACWRQGVRKAICRFSGIPLVRTAHLKLLGKQDANMQVALFIHAREMSPTTLTTGCGRWIIATAPKSTQIVEQRCRGGFRSLSTASWKAGKATRQEKMCLRRRPIVTLSWDPKGGKGVRTPEARPHVFGANAGDTNPT